MINNFKRPLKSESGQALLFVVIALTVALSVGVAISTRNLSMSSRTAKTDTSSRVFSAAEGGIERLLTLSNANLALLDQADPNCGTVFSSDPTVTDLSSQRGCIIRFNNSSGGDPIVSQAKVDATRFRTNDPANSMYEFNLDPSNIKEVALSDDAGYFFPKAQNLYICWQEPKSAISYSIYDDQNHIVFGGFVSDAFSIPGGVIDSSNVDIRKFRQISSGAAGYVRCGQVGPFTSAPFNTLSGNLYGLRVRTLYNTSKVMVRPVNGGVALPYQGYLLTAEGTLTQEGQTLTSKKIKVYKSYPYLPAIFDYAIYSEQDISTR